MIVRQATYGAWGSDALGFAKDVGKDVLTSVVGRVLGTKPSGAAPPPPPVKKTNWPLIIGGTVAGVAVLALVLRR